jgi:suppressor of G2 allele of SKP1
VGRSAVLRYDACWSLQLSELNVGAGGALPAFLRNYTNSSSSTYFQTQGFLASHKFHCQRRRYYSRQDFIMAAAARGQTAFAKGDYPAAIENLTIALKEQQSPLWLIQRSTAYQRSKQYELALADADNAVLLAIQRARREQIATAQFRRAVALHAMGRLGDARMCLNWSFKKNEKEKGLTIWIKKVAKDYEDAGGEGAECNKVTVKEVPEKVAAVGSETKKASTKENEKLASAPAPAPKSLAATPKEKIRHEWYQSPTTVTIEVFAKGVPKDKAEVVIEDGSVSQTPPFLIA